MSLVAQWRRIESELPPAWHDARLSLTVGDPSARARAAAQMGPANPGRSGDALVFAANRSGDGVGPDAVRRLLGRLDAERVAGTLRLVATAVRAEPEAETVPTLATAWETALATLPADWSDLLCDLEVVSTDYLQRAALLLSPLNPTRDQAKVAFRFRVARRFGYGASPPMVRRCLERVDEDGIRGRVAILRALSDTHNVATQGPVWYLEGEAGLSDAVSWFLIEKGWDVVGRDGNELGTVHEVVGDTGKDIFNGLAVSPGFLRSARYVPAERVGTIVEGRIEIDLDEDEFDRMDEHGEVPPSAEIRPDTTDLS